MIRFLLILFLSAFLTAFSDTYAQQGNGAFSATSVLASGQWFKIAVTADGIYRIDYSKLKQLGITNLSNPRIFGNNFGQLSYLNDDPKPDDLKEIPLLLAKGSDDVFNEGDYLLFYGMGTSRWKYNAATKEYNFVRHNYSDTAFYFLTSTPLPGKAIVNAPEISSQPDYTSSARDALYNHEVEFENLIKSGREWFQPVSTLNGIVINPGFTDIILSEKMNYKIRVASRASIPTLFRLFEGTNILAGVLVPEVFIFSTTGTYANISEFSTSSLPSSASPTYEMKFFDNGEPDAHGWIDYVKLQGRALTKYSGKPLQFSDALSVGPGRVTEFTVATTLPSVNVWDVTDPFNIKTIGYTKSADNIKFKAFTDSLRTFIVYTNDKAIIPVIKPDPLANQNLHGSGLADMIIVAPGLFHSYAEKLADIHSENNGLISFIVSPEEIYNEFSGGVPDIAAIRNFLRMKYINQAKSSHPLKYLLLFGDGSYENKTMPPHNPNFVPTYQSQNSNVVVSSFTSDDFYCLLDPGEGEADGTEDIGVGRFPVTDTIQAGIMVSKVGMYLGEKSTGDWRNSIAIVADDEDGNTHMIDAEGLSSYLESEWPVFNIDKIYLDAFRQVTGANGQTYPDVVKKITARINSGCLIFNYLGHGNELGLAAERIVTTNDINSWKNNSKLPLFITATCEFSRFDDVQYNFQTSDYTQKISAGEMVLMNPGGGGIALMTTTRVVYSAPNYTLNRNIYKYAFTRDKYGNALALGDIIRLAKLNSGTGQNKRNFTLLGDPALRLAYPSFGKIFTDSVNNTSSDLPVDSLKALSVIKISGHIEDNKGNLMNTFNGTVSPLIYDKSGRVRTLANDGGSVLEFNLRNNILFSGKTIANKGRFAFTFIVPKDIDYAFGKGKISYYASQQDHDMAGVFTGITVGGFSQSAISDTSGPRIRLYLNDTLFRNGGIADNNPILLAVIEDKGGINTTGSGIGHDLTAVMDNEKNHPFVLNSYFENDFDNYMKGRVVFPLDEIPEGSHSITLKAWDNFNNSAEASLRFIVKTDKGFIINNLINYPNPFADQTNITAEHNRPDKKLHVRINIFDISGKLIRTIENDIFAEGYKLPPVIWDGNIESGKKAGRGIYPYSVTLTAEDGEIARASGRLIIL
jgi:hypothetical protein